MRISDSDLQEIADNFRALQKYYSEFSPRYNLFLATCIHIDEVCNKSRREFLGPYDIARDCPYGGLIGKGNSKLENWFKGLKLLRVHAAIHDACGYMKALKDYGPGYIYALPCGLNSCYLGHITGISYCIYIKLFRRKFYKQFAV